MTATDASVDLTDGWVLSDANAEYRVQVSLPCDVVSALHDTGLIEAPYWGRNEYDLRWISERDWRLTRQIELVDPHVVLELEGVDTVAKIRVNGTEIAQTANAFRRYRLDLSDVARIGENEIEIVLVSPVVSGADAQAKQPFFVPWHAENSPIANGNMLRKPQCDFGWDWNIALASTGLWTAPRIVKHQSLRISRVQIDQAHSDSRVVLDVTVHTEGQTNGEALDVTFCGQHQRITLPVDTKNAIACLRFEIEDPSLWWPAGFGPQTLHDLEVSLGSQTERRRIGLRQITLITETDEIGRGFAFNVNGSPVFTRGANWIPADALSGRITRSAVQDLLQSAVDANMNMVRVWGGGRYEPDWFYDLCDDLGLMVWQDFMFACNLYPSTSEFLAEVDAEVRENVARLNHHASIALWCGDNELVGALNWFKESRDDRDRYLVSYDRLNRTIEAALLDTCPDANWWPSSPSRGTLDFGDGWHDDTSGDMHFWSVWHEGRDFDHYRDVAPRFCSEFGFQSYPSMEAIRRFAAPEDFNISAPVFESHQKNTGGNARIAETMFRYFRFPQGFEDFVYLSQVQQGLAIKTAVSQWRSLKPRCMGTLYWQLNDTWPVASWSSIDHGGGWKLLHYMARRFYEPVYLAAIPEGTQISLSAVNDTPAPAELAWEASALAVAGGERPLASGRTTIATDQVVVLARLDAKQLDDNDIVVMRWTLPDGARRTDHFAPHPYKHYDLTAPKIEMTRSDHGGHTEISLNASAPALFTALEADCPGRFSDNAILLLPEEPTTLTFSPRDPGIRPEFVIRDLHSATCAA